MFTGKTFQETQIAGPDGKLNKTSYRNQTAEDIEKMAVSLSLVLCGTRGSFVIRMLYCKSRRSLCWTQGLLSPNSVLYMHAPPDEASDVGGADDAGKIRIGDKEEEEDDGGVDAAMLIDVEEKINASSSGLHGIDGLSHSTLHYVFST